MLQELHVHNLALIDILVLDFSARPTGLIVLTGETGAGKSIILQAVNLLTGGRGSASWIRSDCEQAAIEAVFALHPDQVDIAELLGEQGLQDDGYCLIRRVLTPDGRSRIYVNDHAVTSRIATTLSAGLLTIAGQHDHQQLLNPRSHLDFLDSYGELWELRRRFTDLFKIWQQVSSDLRQLMEKEQEKEQRRDLLRLQVEEIRKVQPRLGEDEELRRERERLKGAEGLIRQIRNSCHLLDDTVLPALTNLRKQMEQSCNLDAELTPLADRLRSQSFDLEDSSSVLRGYGASLSMDPERLEIISERLAELKQLQRKYGPTLADVLETVERAEAELQTLEHLEEQIAAADLKVEEAATEALLKGVALTHARQETAQRLAEAMERELISLSFTQALFRVQLATEEEEGMTGIHPTGRDTVEFLFSANPGEPPKPLVKIASGGELSRLMLAMKCLLARRDQVDTIIFDEVDAGIGGQAAEAVAAKIRELAGHHQVICITHLPQIAAGADLHFKVEKRVEDGRTRTLIRPLNEEAQVEELARMLSGERPTPQTLAFAAELRQRQARPGSEDLP